MGKRQKRFIEICMKELHKIQPLRHIFYGNICRGAENERKEYLENMSDV